MIPNDRTFNGKDFVEIDGKEYFRFYKICLKGNVKVKIHVVSINSDYKQGIAFRVSQKPEFVGTILLNGQLLTQERGRTQNYVIPVALPEKGDFVIELGAKEGELILANASDVLDDHTDLIKRISKQTGRTREEFRGNSYVSGFTAAHLYGNAFWMEMLSENYYRFHCNDHKMDEDFDDLIFDLKVEFL